MHQTGEAEPREMEMKEMGANKHNPDEIPKVTISEAECKKSVPRLFLAIIKTFGIKCLVAALFKAVFDVLQFVSPIILK